MAFSIYHPRTNAPEELLTLRKSHIELLRSEGLITERPVLRLRSSNGDGIEIVEWRSKHGLEEARRNPKVAEVCKKLAVLAECDAVGALAALPEAGQPHASFALADAPDKTVAVDVYESEVEKSAVLNALMREWVRVLREQGLITDRPALFLQSPQDRRAFLMVYEWASPQSAVTAKTHPRAEKLRHTLDQFGKAQPLKHLKESQDKCPAFLSVDGIDQDLRSRGLIEASALKPRPSVDRSELLPLVRDHWATLRSKGLAAANPILILVNETGGIQYIFKWRSAEARQRSEKDSEVSALMKLIQDRATITQTTGLLEAYQGFDYAQFPGTGGIELLTGKCRSVVQLEEDAKEFEVNVANGFVLMHRSPGHDTDKNGDEEMYVEILQHGGDVLNLTLQAGGRDVTIFRVGQNKDLPQYGLIRARSTQSDFPATAMWVVHWKIWTSLGTLITDPATPLVFGPATVHHYPPVGTEFYSKTGPVKLIHEETGKVVGRLIPKELTAFDILITKDDEIESVILKNAPDQLVKIFNETVRATK